MVISVLNTEEIITPENVNKLYKYFDGKMEVWMEAETILTENAHYILYEYFRELSAKIVRS